MASLAAAYRRMIDRQPSTLRSWAVCSLCWPLAMLFRLLVGVRTVLYRCGLLPSYRAAVPVISVGNLTVGGTGKTPVTDAVVKRLLARGLRVAVVSRGYGGNYAGAVGVVAAGDGRVLLAAQAAGDEPCLLARRNPALLVYVAKVRAAGVRAAERVGVQVVSESFMALSARQRAELERNSATYLNSLTQQFSCIWEIT